MTPAFLGHEGALLYDSILETLALLLEFTAMPKQETSKLLFEVEDAATESIADKTRANDLDGKTWTQYSISIWSDIRKTQEEIALGHPAIFPIALVSRLIRMFTRTTDKRILDPFAGTGSTILAARRLGKHGIGIELSPKFAMQAQQRCEQDMLPMDEEPGSAVVHLANALNLSEFVENGSIDMVITSPPYWDILNEKRTADYKEIRNYGNEEEDLGKISSYGTFLDHLQSVFLPVYESMREGAYCCVIVMDLRKKDRFYPFHSDVAQFMERIGFIYDDLIIWDRRQEYNNLRPLGYPCVFRVNKVHEYILIFQKPTASK